MVAPGKEKNMITIRSTVVAVFALLLTAPSGFAAEAAATKFITHAQYEPSRLLPPPPAADSPKTKEELAELHRIESARTPARLARAVYDDKTEDASIFAEVLGSNFDLAKLPATARMFADIRADEKVAATEAKEFFQRTRPWLADQTLNSCNKSDKPKSAYPSGHSTMGYSFAVVLASLVPEKSQAIFARAAEYAENRLVCGAHYRSDIVGGQVLGTVVGIAMMNNPAFQSEMRAAADELKTKHIASN